MTNLENYPFINVTIEAYFCIRNSGTWGGKGSVGYMRMNFEGVKNNECFSDEFIEKWRQNIIKQHNVTSDDVTFITQEEYNAATQNESDSPVSITVYKDENKPIDIAMPKRLIEQMCNKNKI